MVKSTSVLSLTCWDFPQDIKRINSRTLLTVHSVSILVNPENFPILFSCIVWDWRKTSLEPQTADRNSVSSGIVRCTRYDRSYRLIPGQSACDLSVMWRALVLTLESMSQSLQATCFHQQQRWCLNRSNSCFHRLLELRWKNALPTWTWRLKQNKNQKFIQSVESQHELKGL